MRNLFILFRTYHRFFVFLLLEFICLIIFFRNNHHQYNSYIHSARGVTAKFYSERQKIATYFSLKERNDYLLQENAMLKSKMGVKQKKNPLTDTSFSLVVAEDSVKQTIYYKYLPARVLNNTIDQKNNFITLNRGRKDKIRKNMSVVSSSGVVGKISHVSENYSLVSSVLSSKFRISCITPNGTIGTVSWSSEFDAEHVILNGVPQSEKLKKGDTILTSGFSLFPKDVMIGRIVNAEAAGSNGVRRYKVKLGVNFRRLNFVYIVDDQTTFERTLLEDSVRFISNE